MASVTDLVPLVGVTVACEAILLSASVVNPATIRCCSTLSTVLVIEKRLPAVAHAGIADPAGNLHTANVPSTTRS